MDREFATAVTDAPGILGQEKLIRAVLGEDVLLTLGRRRRLPWVSSGSRSRKETRNEYDREAHFHKALDVCQLK
jgi:hypothetical protein